MIRTNAEGINVPPSRIILIDFDGTCVDFGGAVTEMALAQGLRRTNTGPPNFYTAEDFHPDDRKRVRELSNADYFARKLPPMPGVVEGWQAIAAVGAHPILCSALLPPQYSRTNHADKLGWLEEFIAPVLGRHVLDQAIFTSDKHLIPAAAAVEDKPPKMMEYPAIWMQFIISQPYNEGDNPRGTRRLDDWRDKRLIPYVKYAQRRHVRLYGE